MPKFDRMPERRGVIWLNFNRMCPKCRNYIPKYKRVCPECGVRIKSLQGRVYVAK